MESTMKIGIRQDPHEVLREVDQAIEADNAARVKRKEVRENTLADDSDRLSKLPQLLRWVGALVLISAAAVFLGQSWDSMDHIMRYYSFLGFTGLLSACGFISGIKMKADKGARTFLALSAAIIPVHFCQLGGLLFSLTPAAEALRASYPAYALWVAPDASLALVTTAIGVLALIPIALLAFTSLVRAEARKLSVVYLALNATLLIPTRIPNELAIIVFLTTLAAAAFDIKVLQRSSACKTKEGTITRAMLWTAPLLLIARTLHLYDPSLLFVSAIFAAIGVIMFGFIPGLYNLKDTAERRLAEFYQALSTVPFSIACVTAGIGIYDLNGFTTDCLIPLLTVPFGIVLIVLSLNAINDGAGYRKAAGFVLVGGSLLQLFAVPGVVSAFTCIVIGTLGLSYGFGTKQKALFFSGCVGLGAGLLYYMHYAVELFDNFGPWVSLAIVGVTTIFVASYLESHGAELRRAISSFRKTVNNME